MYLLMNGFDVWAANILTGAVVVGLLRWFALKLIATYEKRLEKIDKIEKNYLDRFERMHNAIENSEKRITEHFTEEIKQVTHDKNNYRQQQALLTGEMSTEVKNLIRSVDELKRKVEK
jgi:hypothetical protein